MSERRAPYPGNHLDKQTARLLLYKHALSAPIQGHAVTLAGPDPQHELVLLRDYLQWPSNRAWFVDKDKATAKAMDSLRRKWPGVNTELADLRKVLPKLGGVGFANLDFMGWPLQRDSWECFEQTVEQLLPGAVLGFTWLRGREHFDVQSCAHLLWKLGKGYRGNDRRWAGFLRAVYATDSSLKLLDRWQYNSNHSPMSVAVFRKG